MCEAANTPKTFFLFIFDANGVCALSSFIQLSLLMGTLLDAQFPLCFWAKQTAQGSATANNARVNERILRNLHHRSAVPTQIYTFAVMCCHRKQIRPNSTMRKCIVSFMLLCVRLFGLWSAWLWWFVCNRNIIMTGTYFYSTLDAQEPMIRTHDFVQRI